MKRSLVLSSLAASGVLWLAVGVVALRGSWPNQGEPQFCHLGQYIGFSGDAIDYGEVTLVVDQPVTLRESCPGRDLQSFSKHELSSFDGVLFEDCVISWTNGGRSNARDEGIPCEAG